MASFLMVEDQGTSLFVCLFVCLLVYLLVYLLVLFVLFVFIPGGSDKSPFGRFGVQVSSPFCSQVLRRICAGSIPA